MNPEFGRRLLDWYGLNKRDLPWREDREFYHVYLSEIMLQQTRAKAVIPYYERFLLTFPTMERFAKAPEDVYLKLWEGLGYYSRVKNLHKSIFAIVSSGKIPDTKKELLSLPGIGDYTASVLLAICYGKKEIALDGNLFRVFSRLTCYEKNLSEKGAKEDAKSYFLQRAVDDYGDFNQALMNLGEMVCLPHGRPLCGGCPLREFCSSYENNTMLLYPKKKEKAMKKTVDKTVFVIVNGDQVLIRKREDRGLLASLYEFWNVDGILNEEEALAYLNGLGFDVLDLVPLGQHRHVFTHLVWNMVGYRVDVSKIKTLDKAFFSPIDRFKKDFALPSAFVAFEKCL